MILYTYRFVFLKRQYHIGFYMYKMMNERVKYKMEKNKNETKIMRVWDEELKKKW